MGGASSKESINPLQPGKEPGGGTNNRFRPKKRASFRNSWLRGAPKNTRFLQGGGPAQAEQEVTKKQAQMDSLRVTKGEAENVLGARKTLDNESPQMNFHQSAAFQKSMEIEAQERDVLYVKKEGDLVGGSMGMTP